jgi:hypothetical protein
MLLSQAATAKATAKASKIESLFIATSCHRGNEAVPIWLHAQASLGPLGSGEQNAASPVPPYQIGLEKIMIRLLIAGAAVYVAYRITREIIDEVPDDFDPLPLPPPDDRKPLRRQSAAMGVEPQR